MIRRTLPREAKFDAVDYCRAALVDVRAILDLAGKCGPVLICAYRALAALGELAEQIEKAPEEER